MNTIPSSDDLFEKELKEKTILFPLGVPGFPTHHRFVLAKDDKASEIFWLQSVDDAKLAFAVIEVHRLKKDYVFEVEDTDLTSIGSPEEKDCVVYFILCLEKNATKIKGEANMRAPVVLNLKNRLARQVIIRNESQYSESESFEL